jgi:hypothetical protein
MALFTQVLILASWATISFPIYIPHPYHCCPRTPSFHSSAQKNVIVPWLVSAERSYGPLAGGVVLCSLPHGKVDARCYLSPWLDDLQDAPFYLSVGRQVLRKGFVEVSGSRGWSWPPNVVSVALPCEMRDMGLSFSSFPPLNWFALTLVDTSFHIPIRIPTVSSSTPLMRLSSVNWNPECRVTSTGGVVCIF